MKKEKLKKQVFESALQIIEQEGMEELNVRKIAEMSSCSLGSIYNVFGNLHDLHLHINATILSRLYETLSQAVRKGISEGKPLLSLFHDLGKAYIEFGQKHRSLWKALFEYLPSGPMPEWYSKRAKEGIYQLSSYISAVYGISESEAKRLVGFFWSSIHGICSILLNRKMEMVSELFPNEYLQDYIEYSLTGLFRNSSDQMRLPHQGQSKT